MAENAQKSVYFVDAARGTAGVVTTTRNTIGEFLTDNLGAHDPAKFLIRHQGKCPEGPQQQINDGDTISVTLTKIEGHVEMDCGNGQLALAFTINHQPSTINYHG